MCPAKRLVVVPDATSHTKTERSPPDDANFALSFELERIILIANKEEEIHTL